MKRAAVINIQRMPPQTWEDGRERFLLLRKSQGAAKRTLTGYKENITAFFRRYPAAWSAKCRDCLLLHLSQEGISPATHNARLKTLKPFFDFCVSEGVFSSSPAEGLKYRKESPRPVDHDMEDIRKLLETIGSKTYSKLRDSCLVLFQLDTGSRPSEALKLLPSDLDINNLHAIIRAAIAKTGETRTVFFSSGLAEWLRRLSAARPPEWGEETPFFCTVYGDEWNTRAWTGQLARYAKKAGLKRFSAYDLRHQFALEALRNGMDVFTLQKFMGHADISMTRRYIALSYRDLRTAHDKASPIKNLLPSHRVRAQKPRP